MHHTLKELDMPSLKSVKQMDWVVYLLFNQNLTCTDSMVSLFP